MSRAIRILVVEDSKEDAELAIRTLRRGGFDVGYERVETAAALEVALSRQAWDAVISDFNMEGFTGLHALKIVRSAGLDIPFILVSGTIGEEIAVELMKAGASDYVMKGNLARLVPALERELAEAAIRAEHRQAQRDLIESEAGLHRAQLMARLAHVITGPDGSFEAWSVTLPQLIGVDSAQMPASTREWLDLLHPDDRAKFRAKAIEAGVKGIRTDVEYRLLRSDGAWIHVRQVIEPLVELGNPDGKWRWFNTLQDVTWQKRAEEGLRVSEERFRAMFEKAAVGIVHTDMEGRFLMVNPKFCQMLRYSPEEAASLGIRDVTDPADVQNSLDSRLRLHAREGVPYETEARLVRKDRSQFWAHITTSLVHAANGRAGYFISVLHDTSERKEAQERITRLNRVYAVLSGINTLIVRVRDKNELYRAACRIAVGAGDFAMAWIGVVDKDAAKVRPVASAGSKQEDMAFIEEHFSLAEDSPMGNSLTARAIREKKVFFSNDAQNDPNVLFKQEHAERGTHSLAILPLLVADEAVGVLVLYAEEAGFFDEEELRLLAELAGDISFALEHIEKSEKVDYLAYYDSLTGLANRTLFHERLTQQLHAAAGGQHKVALLIADLERFKSINDSLGRQAGDLLLKQIAERLRSYAPEPVEIARVGADQFAFVVPDVKQDDEVARFTEQGARDCLGAPFRLYGTEVRVRAKVGISLFPNDGMDADTLTKNADAALDRAKATGSPYLFFTQEMTERVAGKLALESQLRHAVENEEFILHYHPKVTLDDRRIVGVEALIRWMSPGRGLVPPGHFIPLLEETGLILEVGAWAIRRAILDRQHWLSQGVAAPRIAVNVSQLQLRQRDFVDVVRAAVQQGASPPGLELEITESLLMEDIEESIRKLTAIRDMGISVAIDDFGTGYSSLGYLAKLPVQALKIDRSFIISMLDDPDTMTLVSTIISLAHSLRLLVIAEGVETEEQARMLRLLRCDQMQGYLFSKPLPFDELTPILPPTVKFS